MQQHLKSFFLKKKTTEAILPDLGTWTYFMDTVTLWSGSYGCLCFMSCLDLHISAKHYHSLNPILVVEFRTVEHCLFTCSASVKEGSKKICEKAVM